MMSIGMFAYSLSVHPDTVRRWAKQGKIKFRKTSGGHRRFSMQELNKITRGIKSI